MAFGFGKKKPTEPEQKNPLTDTIEILGVQVQISSKSEDSSVTRIQFPNSTIDGGMASDAFLELAKEKFSQPAHPSLPAKNISISFDIDDQIQIELNSQKIYATYDHIKELLKTMSKMSSEEIKNLSNIHRGKETHNREVFEARRDAWCDKTVAPFVAAFTDWMRNHPTLQQEFLKITHESEGEKGSLEKLKELLTLAYQEAQRAKSRPFP